MTTRHPACNFSRKSWASEDRSRPPTSPTSDWEGLPGTGRAYASLIEELDAVAWYDQRVDACEDEELRAILIHNRDEEKEHGAMLLEWLRRKDEAFDGYLRSHLWREGPIVRDDSPCEDMDPSALHIGSLRGSRK